MRIFVTILAVMVMLVIGGCSNNGPVYTGPDNTPITPPPGDNPGSDVYQLQCSIDLSRSVGKAPMGVNMLANVVGGLAPYYYRWDVNGDGAWDYGGEGVSEIGIHFTSAGLFEILLEVEDAQGQAYRSNALVDVKPSGPSPQASAWPNVGNAPLLVTLDASDSFDPDGSVVFWEWDFEADGVYDYESDTDPVTTFTYNVQGTYNPTLRVTDDDGLSNTMSLQVIVF